MDWPVNSALSESKSWVVRWADRCPEITVMGSYPKASVRLLDSKLQRLELPKPQIQRALTHSLPLDMISADSRRAAASEPILLPRFGMVHLLSKPCGAMLRKAD